MTPPAAHYWVHAKDSGPATRGYWAFLVAASSFDAAAEVVRRDCGEAWEVVMVAKHRPGTRLKIRVTAEELANRPTSGVLLGRQVGEDKAAARGGDARPRPAFRPEDLSIIDGGDSE